jgi:hypothetical protein
MSVTLFETSTSFKRIAGSIVQPLLSRFDSRKRKEKNSGVSDLKPSHRLSYDINSLLHNTLYVSKFSTVSLHSTYQDVPTLESYYSQKKAYIGLKKLEKEALELSKSQHKFFEIRFEELREIFPESVLPSMKNSNKLNKLKCLKQVIEERITLFKNHLTIHLNCPLPILEIGEAHSDDTQSSYLREKIFHYEECLFEVLEAIHRQKQLDDELILYKECLMEQLDTQSKEYEITGKVTLFETNSNIQNNKIAPIYLDQLTLLQQLGLQKDTTYKKSKEDFLQLVGRKQWLKKQIKGFYSTTHLESMSQIVNNYMIEIGDIHYLNTVKKHMIKLGLRNNPFFEKIQTTLRQLHELNHVILPRLEKYREEKTVFGTLRNWFSRPKTQEKFHSVLNTQVPIIEPISLKQPSSLLRTNHITLIELDHYTSFSTLLYMKQGVNEVSCNSFVKRMTPNEETIELAKPDITTIDGLYAMALEVKKLRKSKTYTPSTERTKQHMISRLQMKIKMGMEGMFRNVFIHDEVFSELTPMHFNNLVEKAVTNKITGEEKSYFEQLQLINNRFKQVKLLAEIKD